VILAIGIGVSGPEPVSRDRYFAGLLLAAAVSAAVPAAYFALGRALSGKPVVLWVVFTISLLPLIYVGFLTLLMVAGLVYCPPDAYECPV
jgi:hypothetical protein